VATDAAVGKKIGRVGKDGVEAALGIFGGNAYHAKSNFGPLANRKLTLAFRTKLFLFSVDSLTNSPWHVFR